MKVIDELIKYANGETLLRKARLDNDEIYEYNGNSIVGQIIERYGVDKDLLNAELEDLEEEKDIKELPLDEMYLTEYQQEVIVSKINELIREVNKLKNRGE